MKITLDRLQLSHFKGAKKVEMTFKDGDNTVSGKNGAGKTTLYDAMWFLFFGKDSTGKADFDIKTKEKDGTVISSVNHVVHGFFTVDGIKRDFKRDFYEVRDKKTGVLKGHSTDFTVDGFPKATKSEYDREIASLFTEESFKLLTNPVYFNSLKMEERRRILIGLVGELSEEEIMEKLFEETPKSKPLTELSEILKVQKNFAAIKLKAQRDKKALVDQIEGIQPRIDENQRNIPEEQDWDTLQEIIDGKQKELSSIEKQIMDSSEKERKLNQMVLDRDRQVQSLENQMATMEREARQKASIKEAEQSKDIQDLEFKISSFNSQKTSINEEIEILKSRLSKGQSMFTDLIAERSKTENKIMELRVEYNLKAGETFTVEGDCPYCGTELAKVSKFSASKETEFNTKKVRTLEEINERGVKLKASLAANETDQEKYKKLISGIEAEIKEKTDSLQEIQNEIGQKSKELAELKSKPKVAVTHEEFLPEEYNKLKNTVSELIKKDFGKVSNEEFLQSKQSLVSEINKIQVELNKKAEIDKINLRIEELNREKAELSAKYAESEGLEKAIKRYSKARISMVEDKINSKFTLVKFVMFEQNMTNDDEKEICDCVSLKDGSTWHGGMNGAQRIQAGMDIIRTLNREYNAYLPLFIDDRALVTEVPKMETQTISLVVDPYFETVTLN